MAEPRPSSFRGPNGDHAIDALAAWATEALIEQPGHPEEHSGHSYAYLKPASLWGLRLPPCAQVH